MAEYTPTTDEVADAYTQMRVRESHDDTSTRKIMTAIRALPEWDRWLASVKAEAWDEGAAATIQSPQDPHSHPDWLAEHNPYREEL